MVDGTISVVVTININNGWPASEGQDGQGRGDVTWWFSPFGFVKIGFGFVISPIFGFVISPIFGLVLICVDFHLYISFYDRHPTIPLMIVI